MQIISNTTKTETGSAIVEGNAVTTSEVRVEIMKVHLLSMQLYLVIFILHESQKLIFDDDNVFFSLSEPSLS